MAQLYT